jgi:capsid protein
VDDLGFGVVREPDVSSLTNPSIFVVPAHTHRSKAVQYYISINKKAAQIAYHICSDQINRQHTPV